MVDSLPLSTFAAQYFETAFWASTTGDDDGTPLDRDYGPSDLSDLARAQMLNDCATFERVCSDEIDGDDSQAGHDFWLTRNGHGCGFWDGDWAEPAATILDKAAKACGEYSLYIGDDGQIHGYSG